MSSYFLKYRKNTERKEPRVSRTSEGNIMLLSRYAVCGNKKLIFIKEKEASGLPSQLGIKTGLRFH